MKRTTLSIISLIGIISLAASSMPTCYVKAGDIWVGNYEAMDDHFRMTTLEINKGTNGQYNIFYIVPMGNYGAKCTGKPNKKGILVTRGMDGEETYGDCVKVLVKHISGNKYKVTEYYEDDTYSTMQKTYDGKNAVYSQFVYK